MANKQQWLDWINADIDWLKAELAKAKGYKQIIKALPPGEVEGDPTEGGVSTQDEGGGSGGDRPTKPPPNVIPPNP